MNTLLKIVAFFAGVFLVAFAIHLTDRPEVIVSWSTKQCLKVINIDGTEGDCNHLPEKYDLTWGE